MSAIKIGVIVLGIGAVLFFVLSGSPSAQSLSAEDFVTQYKKTSDAILVDVRTPEEFRSGHIEGAVNIDFQDASFMAEVQKLDTTKTYFVYCRSGNRSKQAISVMNQQGISSINELQGGIISHQNTLTLSTGT
ncbi:MAG: rhodanese-like domain-containing protein [Candidatus Moranbacteria bacterium]|nr:rhodanese-like domain-containing protein [Candidatus Moranbacteria bacterium]